MFVRLCKSTLQKISGLNVNFYGAFIFNWPIRRIRSNFTEFVKNVLSWSQ